MKRDLCWLTFLSMLLFISAVARADGDIYVGGPWGTRINSLPYTISTPGSYYLGSNLSYSGGNGITITSDHVTLDLMGFSLYGSSGGNGIHMHNRANVEIRNGTFAGWGTGIYEDGEGSCHRIINVRLRNCYYGISLLGDGHLIKGCEVVGANLVRGYFIQRYGTISGCLAQYFTTFGIQIGDGSLNSGGIISGNVIDGSYTANLIGLFYYSPSGQCLMIGNEVSNCSKNLNISSGTSAIGNTFYTDTGQIGIFGNNDPTTVLDQNTVVGPGTHTSNITDAKTRNNAGFP